MKELIGTEKQIVWAEGLRKEFIKNVIDYKEHFNNATFNKRNYIIEFKKEIMEGETGKVNMGMAAEKLNKILDSVITNMENETSAKKFIDIKTGLRCADASIENYVIREFI